MSEQSEMEKYANIRTSKKTYCFQWNVKDIANHYLKEGHLNLLKIAEEYLAEQEKYADTKRRTYLEIMGIRDVVSRLRQYCGKGRGE